MKKCMKKWVETSNGEKYLVKITEDSKYLWKLRMYKPTKLFWITVNKKVYFTRLAKYEVKGNIVSAIKDAVEDYEKTQDKREKENKFLNCISEEGIKQFEQWDGKI